MRDIGSLFRALKIIMHFNAVSTRDNPQRMHMPLQLDLSEVEAVDAPVDRERGTGLGMDDFAIGDIVQVWHARTWWHGKVVYKARVGTLSVRLTGSRNPMTGIQPNQVKHAL